ncbi:cell division protein ZapB [Pedobacter sp. L105]|uniref:cell division protein ZapB n=1 Tax=Pedobacter sp. L105 TaxID=1641871 RepID=UPI00131C8E99|nr:cell division protein ZapB [Pedobacter sp. L105]
MKKLSLFLVIILSFYSSSYAQNTYPWAATGNIGIGTVNPQYPLDVAGSLRIGAQGGNDYTLITGGFGVGSTLRMFYADGTENTRLTGNNDSWLNAYQGNVGIGTGTPKSKLHVGGGTSDLISIGTTDYSGNSGQALAGVKAGEIADGHGGTIEFQTLSWGASPYALTTKMIIQGNSGNVGIGIANPLEKLAVNGIIHSQEVKVDMTGWSDYVFKKEYPLLPLSEVKTYIDKNQHLPDMPSESEVIKTGLSLGDMNKLLTKKVEELTLYLIDNQKQLQQLQEKMERSSQNENRQAQLEEEIKRLKDENQSNFKALEERINNLVKNQK